MIFLFLIFCRCASQAPPQGGPEDKTPPAILETDPSKDAVRVSRRPIITIRFSEAMNKASVEQALYLMPRQSVKYDWSGNTLILVLQDSLEADQTCVITLGENAKDRRQNPMGHSYTFAFSTGEKIDRGEIRGHVWPLPVKQTDIRAYRLKANDPVPSDSLVYRRYADYIVPVNEKGHFHLSYLADGIYRLYALSDLDQNGVYTPGTDRIGVPEQDIVLNDSSRLSSGWNFYLIKEDTVRFQIESVYATDSQTVCVIFTKPINRRLTDSLLQKQFRLISEKRKTALIIRDLYFHPVNAMEWRLLTDGLDSSDRYRFEIDTLISADGDQLLHAKKHLERFDAAPPVKPRLEWVFPEKGLNRLLPGERISVRFNKGIQKTLWNQFVTLLADTLSVETGRWQWYGSGFAEYIPDSLWRPGQKYTWILPAGKILDVQQIPLSDTVLRQDFQIYPSDSLGLLSGQVFAGDEFTNQRLHLILRPITANTRVYEKELSVDGRFQFDFVVPGQYILELFADRNANGKFDAGKVIPFVPPEPWSRYSDTLAIRANWETAGVEWQLGRKRK